MKRCICCLSIMVLAGALYARGTNQAGAGNAGGGAASGDGQPLGKYSPSIPMSTSMVITTTVRFDDKDPDARSFDENRWIRVYREDLGVNLTNLWIATDNDSNTTKWNAAIASGLVPDIASVSDQVYKQLLDADMIADMTDIFETYATPELRSTLLDSDYQMMTVNGRMYGFPAGKKALNGTSVLFIRQDWLDKLGLKAPETVDEVINLARKFKEAKLGGPNTIGILFSRNNTGGTSVDFGDGKWDGLFNAYNAYLGYWLNTNGRLEFSTVKPEVRTALLALQALYKEGLMNQDFAVTNNTLAQEHVASGRAGLYYGSAWSPTQGIQALYNSDGSTQYTSVFPPPLVRGQQVKMQTNSPKAFRTFVSADSKNPEAAVKMANMSYAYKFRDFKYYMFHGGEIVWMKYTPWGDCFSPPPDDLYKANAIREAQLAHSRELTDASWQGQYDNFMLSEEGKLNKFHQDMWGIKGSMTRLYDAYLKGGLLNDTFYGLPTDTMSVSGTLLQDALSTAMYEVVSGADISVWDRAVEVWHRTGGDKMTEEVNAWYKSAQR